MDPQDIAHDRALELAEDAHARGDETGWLEPFYAAAGQDTGNVPWYRDEPNEFLVGWLDDRAARGGGQGSRALVVGCGLGNDAEELSRRGYAVTAFDIAPSAVEWARKRNPSSTVEYVAADLLHTPAEWAQAFDLVVEIFTVQVLRGEPRREALLALPGLVAPGGTLLLICRAREDDEDEGDLPFPLTKRELSTIAQLLTTESFEDFYDAEGHHRFRAAWSRP